MGKTSPWWNVISWIFGGVVFINGLLNIIWGNDRLLGLAFVLFSLLYFPPTVEWIQRKFGFSIHFIIKIVLAILIIWISLVVGAFAEDYYPNLFD